MYEQELAVSSAQARWTHKFQCNGYNHATKLLWDFACDWLSEQMNEWMNCKTGQFSESVPSICKTTV